MFYLLLFIFICNTHTAYAKDWVENWTDNHRFNPFQFPLPEYHLKANIVKLKNLDILPDDYKFVKLLDHSTFLPESSEITKSEVILNPLFIQAKDRNDKLIFIMHKEKGDFILCSDDLRKIRTDYCSTFNSRRDYFFKLWTLTPEDLAKKEYAQMGYSWLVHQKGSFFEFVDKLTIYEKDDFVFFRTNLTSKSSRKVSFYISDRKTDDLYSVSFVVDDEKLIMNFVRSFQ